MLSRRQFLIRSGAAGAVCGRAASAAARRPQRAQGGGAAPGGSPRASPRESPGRGRSRCGRGMAELERRGGVRLEVARDKGFRKRRRARADRDQRRPRRQRQGARQRAEPARAVLLPLRDARRAQRGRALPHRAAGRLRQPLTFAFFSCQDCTHGYYNAHEVMAREDLDFVVCLGDYIYAETYHTLAGGTRCATTRSASPATRHRPRWRRARALPREVRALPPRPGLRKVHAKAPMVVVWDDHEVQDNYAGAAPDGGLPPEQRYARRAHARRATGVLESMPTFAGRRERIYRALRFGTTMDLIMLDQRRYRDDQPCGDATVPPCPELHAAARPARPRADGLGQAPARVLGAAWKVIGNEVMMMPAKVTGGALRRVRLLARLSARARGAAEPHPARADRGRRVHHRRHPHVHRRRRADDRRRRRRDGRARVRRRRRHVAELRRDRPADRRRAGAPGQRREPAHRPRRSSTRCAGSTRGSTRPTSTTTASGSSRSSRKRLRRDAQARLDDQARSTATRARRAFRWRVERGQKSIKGVNGPPA